MIEFIKDYGLFLAKTITIVVAIFMIASALVSAFRREKEALRERIMIRKLNRHYEYFRDSLKHEMLSHFELKKAAKERKKQRKTEKKEAKKPEQPEKNKIFVLNFKGDLRASAISSLREEVTAVLTVAKETDEVLVRLESGGGFVNAYGLAASQLQRVKDRKIPLTVAVDKIAASGGYLMASVADRILAAPFAVIGSIGVVTELPNFNRLLKKHDIDFELLTAGEYKRTLTIFGENTEKGRKKFIEQLEDVHSIFKEFLSAHRSQLDIQSVATGEHWYGRRAVELKLVDVLQTSDDYLLAASEDRDIYEVEYKPKEPLRERLASGLEGAISRVLFAVWERGQKHPLV